MKRRVYWMIGAVFLAGLVAALSVSAVWQRRAKIDAQNMCSAFKPGITVAQAQTIASQNNGQVSQSSQNEFFARTSGGGLICRCRVEVAADAIASVKDVLCLN